MESSAYNEQENASPSRAGPGEASSGARELVVV